MISAITAFPKQPESHSIPFLGARERKEVENKYTFTAPSGTTGPVMGEQWPHSLHIGH